MFESRALTGELRRDLVNIVVDASLLSHFDWSLPITYVSYPKCFQSSLVTTGPLRALVK